MKTKKQKPKTAEDLFVENFIADVERARKEKGVAPEVAKAEAALDAEAAELFRQTSKNNNSPKLDTAAALGRIEREVPSDYAQYTHQGKELSAFDRIGNWQPPMPVDPESLKPLAADIAAAKARVESARVAAMTPEEKELYTLEQTQAKLLADEAASAEHAKRLADPKVKEVLDKLRKLDTDTAEDESWTYAETVAIARAIFAIEFQGSDLTAALALADEAFGIQRQKKQDALTAREKEVERLRAEMALLGDKPAEQTTETKTDPPADRQTESSASDWYTLRQAYETLKADPNATYAAVEAANSAWYVAFASDRAAQSGDGSAATEGAAT